MCMYCMIGDHFFRHDPPWHPNHPLIPRPLRGVPINPWDLSRVRELEDLLRRVKELEDKLGCPCEPNKADYLDLTRKRIEELESKLDLTKK